MTDTVDAACPPSRLFRVVVFGLVLEPYRTMGAVRQIDAGVHDARPRPLACPQPVHQDGPLESRVQGQPHTTPSPRSHGPPRIAPSLADHEGVGMGCGVRVETMHTNEAHAHGKFQVALVLPRVAL